MDYTDVIIETPRLKLVPISDKYASEIFKELTPEITTFMFPRSPEKIEETLEYIHSVYPKLKNGEELNLTILNKETGEFLGGGGIHNTNTKTPEFGIWIKKSAHGNKFGQEAIKGIKDWVDQNLEYEYLRYPVDKRNIPSRKIAESLGGVIGKEYTKINQSGNTLDEVEYWIYK